MALQKQSAAIPIRGLNTHADPKSAALGELVTADNVVFERTASGGAEARKRYGGTSLTKNIFGGGTLSNGKKLATFLDQRLQIANGKLYSYSPQTTSWHDKGAVSGCGVTAEKVFGYTQSMKSPCCAVVGNLLCYAHRDGGSKILITVIDLNTNQRLLNAYDNGFGSPTAVRVVALATSFMILSINTTTMQACRIDTSAPTTVTSPSTVASDVASVSWDAIRNGTRDEVLIAYHSSVGNSFKLLVWTTAMATGSTTGNANVPDQCIAFLDWDASDGSVYCAYAGSAVGVKFVAITPSVLAITATTVADATVTAVRNITGSRSGTTNTIFVEIAAASTWNTKIRKSTGGAFADYQLALGIAAKCFKVGSTAYLPMTYESTTQSTYFLADVSTASTPIIVGKALYGLGGGLSKAAGVIGNCAAISATAVAMPCLRFSFSNATLGTINDAYFLRWDFAPVLGPCRSFGENLLIPGASPRIYDGVYTTEAGHHLAPEISGLAQSAGGALTALATYSVTSVFFYVDSRGQVHESKPAAPSSITLTGGNQTISWTVSHSRVGDKVGLSGGSSNMWVEHYITAGNGQTYYFHSSTANTPATDSVAVSATLADTTVTSNKRLYTTGNVQPNTPFPPARLIEVLRNRLFLAGTENSRELWVGNEQIPGEGASVSDQLVIELEADDGAVTAMAEMDDRLVLGKRSSIYLLAGAGPTRQGAGQFEQPARLTAAVGFTSQAGVTKTKDGLMFTGPKGRFLLPLGGGQPVRLDKIDGYDSLAVTGGCLADSDEQARLVTSDGRTLVYHHGVRDEQGMGFWSTFTGQAAVDCTTWNGKWLYLASDGTVTEEVTGQYADNGVAINEKIVWAWLGLAGLLGKCRLYALNVLAEFMASFTLSASLAYGDFDAATVETQTLAVTTATKLPIAMMPAHQRATSYQVTLQETSTTEGFRVSALAAEVGVKAGVVKLPTTQRMT